MTDTTAPTGTVRPGDEKLPPADTALLVSGALAVSGPATRSPGKS